MLLKRILTASIVAPIAVFGILVLTQTSFALAVALILIISSWEYCNLIQIKHLAGKALYALLILLVTYFLSNALSNLTILYAAALVVNRLSLGSNISKRLSPTQKKFIS